MKTTKNLKKTTKSVAKKRPAIAKVAKKKIIIKQPAKVVATKKKLANPKRKRSFKLLGIFVALGGTVGLIVLIIIGVSGSFKLATLGQSVLGMTEETPLSPSDVLTENTDEGVKISWKNNNPDWKSSSYSHIVYRKNSSTGNLIKMAQLWPILKSEGTSFRIKYNIEPPTSFVDTFASKGFQYTYYVSTSTQGSEIWSGALLESDLSEGSEITCMKSGTKTPVFSINTYTPRTITLKAKVDNNKDKLIYYKVNVKKVDDVNPYASYYKIYYNRPEGVDESYLLGSTVDEVDKRVKLSVDGNQIVASLVNYATNIIAPGTKYKITVSQVSVTGYLLASKYIGATSEVTLSSTYATITTPIANVAPETPSGLKLENLSTNEDETKTANISFKMPTKPLDDDNYGISGYSGSLSCYNQAWEQVSNWSGEIKVPYVFSEQNRLYFSIDGVDKTAVSCNLKLKAYNKKYNSSSPALQSYYSPESILRFNTGFQPDIGASSANNSVNCFVYTPNNLKVKFWFWRYIYSNGTITCKSNELLKDKVIKTSDLQSTPNNRVKITSVGAAKMSRQGDYYIYNWSFRFRGTSLNTGTTSVSLKPGAISNMSGAVNGIIASDEIITSK